MSLIRVSPLSGMGPTWESPHDYAAAQDGTRGWLARQPKETRNA